MAVRISALPCATRLARGSRGAPGAALPEYCCGGSDRWTEDIDQQEPCPAPSGLPDPQASAHQLARDRLMPTTRCGTRPLPPFTARLLPEPEARASPCWSCLMVGGQVRREVGTLVSCRRAFWTVPQYSLGQVDAQDAILGWPRPMSGRSSTNLHQVTPFTPGDRRPDARSGASGRRVARLITGPDRIWLASLSNRERWMPTADSYGPRRARRARRTLGLQLRSDLARRVPSATMRSARHAPPRHCGGRPRSAGRRAGPQR